MRNDKKSVQPPSASGKTALRPYSEEALTSILSALPQLSRENARENLLHWVGKYLDPDSYLIPRQMVETAAIAEALSVSIEAIPERFLRLIPDEHYAAIEQLFVALEHFHSMWRPPEPLPKPKKPGRKEAYLRERELLSAVVGIWTDAHDGNRPKDGAWPFALAVLGPLTAFGLPAAFIGGPTREHKLDTLKHHFIAHEKRLERFGRRHRYRLSSREKTKRDAS